MSTRRVKTATRRSIAFGLTAMLCNLHADRRARETLAQNVFEAIVTAPALERP